MVSSANFCGRGYLDPIGFARPTGDPARILTGFPAFRVVLDCLSCMLSTVTISVIFARVSSMMTCTRLLKLMRFDVFAI